MTLTFIYALGSFDNPVGHLMVIAGIAGIAAVDAVRCVVAGRPGGPARTSQGTRLRSDESNDAPTQANFG